MEEKEKYVAMKKWNKFIRCVIEARKAWKEVQVEVGFMDRRELENFPAEAQRRLNMFRRVGFEWMLPMLVDYYRGAGGLDSMFIILPVEKKKEKKG